MRSKADFENLVYNKAEIIRNRDKQLTVYRRTAVSAVAVLAVIVTGYIGVKSVEPPTVENSAGETAGANTNPVYGYSEEVESNSIDGILSDTDTNITDNAIKNGISADEFSENTAEADSGEYGDIPINDYNDEYYVEKDELEISADGIPESTFTEIDYYSETNSEKRITDEDAINRIVQAIDEIQTTNPNSKTFDKQAVGFITVRTTDPENGFTTEKQLYIYSDWIYILEQTFSEESYPNSISDKVYECGITDEFISAVRENIDENFLTE